MLTDNYIPISQYLAFNVGQSISGMPQVISNSGTGGAACSTTCASDCKDTCSGDCKSTCTGSCAGSCSGSCTDGCSTGCKSGCKGNCKGTCTNGCETPCKTYCQTYCEKQQTFSDNTYNKKPTNAGNTFTWSSTVAEGETIMISHEDWNTLADYVNSAAKYCTGGDTSRTAIKVSEGDLITADIFNSMSERLSTITSALSSAKRTTEKIKNSSIIYADDFKALKTGFNNAKIKSGTGTCCQKGETKKSEYNSAQPCADGQKGNP